VWTVRRRPSLREVGAFDSVLGNMKNNLDGRAQR
jgi:hypothetical protein